MATSSVGAVGIACRVPATGLEVSAGGAPQPETSVSNTALTESSASCLQNLDLRKTVKVSFPLLVFETGNVECDERFLISIPFDSVAGTHRTLVSFCN